MSQERSVYFKNKKEIMVKQIVFKKGQALVVDVKQPRVRSGMILVKVVSSCISPGTEMSSISSSGMNLLEKAKAHPDKVKRAFERMKTDGVFAVLSKARVAQGKEAICGYSAAGVVLDVGADVRGFKKGMKVAVAGAGFANHAERVVVPVNLALPIPEGVSFRYASTCALGGIAMQGVRRAEVSLGDFVVVIGCGVLGLLTVQMLKAAGCRVVAVDLDASRLALATQYGAELMLNAAKDDVVTKAVHFCNGFGADKVIITAATSSNTPLSQAFGMSRRKGRVVLVGVIGSEFKRVEMYAKELDFVISTSYGPGRYDEQYELRGNDYPYGYVRWTEKRNMDAYLNLIQNGGVELKQIITAEYMVDEAPKAYEALRQDGGPLLVTIDYPDEQVVNGEKPASSAKAEVRQRKAGDGDVSSWEMPKDGVLKVGLAGVGSFVSSTHIPNLEKLKQTYSVCSIFDQTGMAGREAARLLSDSNLKIETDYDRFLATDIDMVLIGTRHNSHAELAIKALGAGKAVFVEKPMCITNDEFKQLSDVIEKTDAPFMIGYNRRFAPAVRKIKGITDRRVNPLMIHYTMNGGYIPYDAWVHTEEGGGRIIGEACHLFDLFRSLTGSQVESVSVDEIQPNTESVRSSDNVVTTIRYADGSVCTLLYTGLGSKDAPKERMEVFCDEQLFVLNDYKSLETFGVDCVWKSKQVDKGHLAELEAFSTQVARGNRFPIPLEEMKETWWITRKVADGLTA